MSTDLTPASKATLKLQAAVLAAIEAGVSEERIFEVVDAETFTPMPVTGFGASAVRHQLDDIADELNGMYEGKPKTDRAHRLAAHLRLAYVALESSIAEDRPDGKTGEFAWAYRVDGTAEMSGNLARGHEEEGIVRGDSGGHALDGLVREMHWDCLDDAEPFTVTLTPIDESPDSGRCEVPEPGGVSDPAPLKIASQSPAPEQTDGGQSHG